jgi:hypothetical protein
MGTGARWPLAQIPNPQPRPRGRRSLVTPSDSLVGRRSPAAAAASFFLVKLLRVAFCVLLREMGDPRSKIHWVLCARLGPPPTHPTPK